MSDLKKFIRTEVLNFNEYKTVSSVWDLAEKFNKPEKEIIKLDQGENLFSDTKKIAQALGNYQFYNYYPDPEYKKLRASISKYLNLPVEKIIVGSGSDELIDLIFRLTLNIGDEVINFPPTFGMYDVSLTLNRGKIINIPRNENFSIDIPKALKAINKKTKIIIICSPNNPTGNPTPKSDLIKLLETGKLILLDEAYAEYAKVDFLTLTNKYPNLILLRTFSKWAGIAGLRLGYAIMNEYLISQFMKIKPPFNVSLGAEIAGIEILKNIKSATKNIEALKKERARLFQDLNALPYLKVFPSETNFIFVKFIGKDFDNFRNYLKQNQVALRFFVTKLTGSAIRITVGQKKINDQLIKILKDYKNNSLYTDGIIFDMDGVLVDVTNSYRQAIFKTVNSLLENQKITIEDINAIKKISGFNNDWDASYELIRLKSLSILKKDFPKYAKPLNAKTKSSKKYKNIVDVFQRFYLNLRSEEELIINKQLLQNIIDKKIKLGIATSRPRTEALFAIKQFNLENYFDSKYIVAQEDARKEKPFPDPLLETQKRMAVKNPIYVGDTINDYLAAKSAGFPFVLVGNESFGDYQIKSANNLKEILK